MKTPKFIVYPARPRMGGFKPYHPATGTWSVEPKWEGWCSMIHTPSETIFNRYGSVVSIDGDFKKALKQLRTLTKPKNIKWVHAELLLRRHNVGKGTIIVLDLPEFTEADYVYRKIMLASIFGIAHPKDVPSEMALTTPFYSEKNVKSVWRILDKLNKKHYKQTVFDGVVIKRDDSIYPENTTNPDRDFSHWIKFKFDYA